DRSMTVFCYSAKANWRERKIKLRPKALNNFYQKLLVKRPTGRRASLRAPSELQGGIRVSQLA
ncbi:MAG: hypothetical protein AAF621_07970, partial [Pseudomonadota bacterium]